MVARKERALARLHARIRACTKCVAAGYLPSALPIVAGKASDRVMIIGQAPGEVELTTGLPFSGRAGAELRRWLAEAGIEEAHLPYRTSVTKCFPGKAPSGTGDRRPSPPEIALCAPWLDAELVLLRPSVVLLVGTLAIERFWGRAALTGRRRSQPHRRRLSADPAPASKWVLEMAERARTPVLAASCVIGHQRVGARCPLRDLASLRRALGVVRRAVRGQGLDNAGSAARMHSST